MIDNTLIKLLTARRLVVRLAEPYQNDESRKLVIIPLHAFEQLMDAAQQVLLEEISQ